MALKTDDDALTALHNVLYKRPGTAKMRKKDVLQFSGFPFDKVRCGHQLLCRAALAVAWCHPGAGAGRKGATCSPARRRRTPRSTSARWSAWAS